jgi:hypothetical protein
VPALEGPLEQGLILEAEESGHGDVEPEIRQEAGDVDPFSPRVHPAGGNPVHPARGETRDAHGMIDRRVERDRDDGSVSHGRKSIPRSRPFLGRTAPELGQSAPELGPTAPELGPTAPALGPTAPRLGPTARELGRTAPRLGWSRPEFSLDFSWAGLI